MPPNRKTNVVLEDIPTFDVAHLKLAQTHAPAADENYWVWPTNNDSLIGRIQKEEEIRLSLAADHVEQNLVKQSQQLQKGKYDSNERTNASSDDYWNMPGEDGDELLKESCKEVKVDSAVASASYWNWPSVVVQSNERMIQRVLEEERARRLTSVEFYEKGLQRDVDAAAPGLLDPANDSYWAH